MSDLTATAAQLVTFGELAQAFQAQAAQLAGLKAEIERLKAQLAPTPTPTPAPAPASGAPGASFDLVPWKITLPVDSAGGFSGSAVEVKQPALNALSNDWFHMASDGAMEFVVPTDGARTSGSSYPRSELREMVPGGSEISWTVAQGGTLSAALAVVEMPVSSDPAGHPARIVVGQIHGPDDELCRLYFEDDKAGGYRLVFHDDQALKPGTTSTYTETEFVLKDASGKVAKLALGQRFSYEIKVAGGSLTVTAVVDGVTYRAVDPISKFWPGKALYFKAGLYSGVGKSGSGAGTVGTGRGIARFYSLVRPSHP